MRFSCIAPILLCTVIAAPAVADGPKVRFVCRDGTRLVASFHNDISSPSVSLHFQDHGPDAQLPQAPSADGGRYANETIEFWNTGRQATLSRGTHRMACHAIS
jgi:membrane-bound inhibitor of C-type lysozyme